jgi:hypothetical protein
LPLLPWYIGLAIIAIVNAFMPSVLQRELRSARDYALVLGAVPGVYLVLMYLTFRSQE